MKNKILYRYELKWEYYELYRVRKVHITLVTFEVIRNTPCGKWIKVGNKEKWISDNANNKYAHKDEKSALRHFVHRKTRRNLHIMEERERNYEALQLAKEKLDSYE